jgi:CheY-like chemotaxis protein/HPt (histidine-containing phosphotransfer) domain-containing protein
LGDETLIYQANNNERTIYAPTAKILVVDDNTINLNVACGLLRLYKINAETAESGAQAIEMVRKNYYDLIFMDHMMPEMDGVEAVQIMRKMGIAVPIIALTANIIEGAKEKFLSAGMNDLLGKPINKSLLNKMLKDWLPAEKLEIAEEDTFADSENAFTPNQTEADAKFWSRIEQIEGLSANTGLDRVSGQQEIYKKSLKLAINEIEKCDKNLRKFLAANDMRNFSIEAHCMKGTLANIGVMELFTLARDLETASNKDDCVFCTANMPFFL